MNRNIFLILLLSLIPSTVLKSQSITVEAKIDSLQILIGEQAKIQLQVAMGAKDKVAFPVYADTLVRGVEIVDVAKADTQYLNNKERLLITQTYTVTSFDSALYYLPPMVVMVNKKAYQSKALALKVYSIPVDTTHVDQFYGQKSIMNAPFEWEDWYGLIGASFLMFPLLGVLVYLIIRLRDNKPIIRRIKVEQKLPPHQVAIQEFERIKEERIWQKGESKAYYTELTDVLRSYIQNRFGFNALEMTSSEIIERLIDFEEKEAIADLKELFQTADLVKFAKHNPDINENDANLINAIDFINETKIEEDNAKPQPTEITVVEKRSLRVKIILATFVILLSALFCGVLVYIILQLYDLFT